MNLTYYEIYRMRGQAYILRQKLIACACAHGIKAAALTFACSRNTVRKWLRGIQPGKPSKLQKLSRRPKKCPHQTPRHIERRVRGVVAVVEIDGNDEEMVFLTNNQTLSAYTVAELYQARWDIEVFFKQIKRTLQLADFMGHNAKALCWQMWIGLLVHLFL